MTTKCYSCGDEVMQDEAFTIGQYFEVCRKCHTQLNSLIFNGYFDREEDLTDQLVYEHTISARFNQLA